MRSLLRDNPLIRYYALFGANARRRRLMIALLLLYVALLTTIACYLFDSPNLLVGRNSWIFIPLLFTTAYAFIAPACFFFFAPKLRSPEILEELLLTRMSKREVVVGYCLPPLTLFACVVLITLAVPTVVLCYFVERIDRDYPIVAVAHLAGAVVAAAVALRVWTAHPCSTLRFWCQVPIMALLYGVVALFLGVLMAAFSGFMNVFGLRHGEDVMGCSGFIIGALLPAVQAKRFCSLRFFRSVDPEPYQIACWIGNELVPSRRSPEIGATFRRLLALVAHDSRYLIRALVTTALVCLPFAIVAFSRNPSFSSTPMGPWLWSLDFLTNRATVLPASITFGILYLFFRSFARKDRAFVLLAGGIVPSVLLSLIPVFVTMVLYSGVACIAQGLGLDEWPNPMTVICDTAMSFVIVAAFTMYALPRPRSGLYGLLGIIGFLSLPLLGLLHLDERTSRTARIFTLGLTALAIVAIIAIVMVWRRKPRRRTASNFGAFFTVLFHLISFFCFFFIINLPRSSLGYSLYVVMTILIGGFFLTFGFDVLAQRIHRLELAHLEPLTLNTDAIPRSNPLSEMPDAR